MTREKVNHSLADVNDLLVNQFSQSSRDLNHREVLDFQVQALSIQFSFNQSALLRMDLNCTIWYASSWRRKNASGSISMFRPIIDHRNVYAAGAWCRAMMKWEAIDLVDGETAAFPSFREILFKMKTNDLFYFEKNSSPGLWWQKMRLFDRSGFLCGLSTVVRLRVAKEACGWSTR